MTMIERHDDDHDCERVAGRNPGEIGAVVGFIDDGEGREWLDE